MATMFAPLPLPGTGDSLADDVAAWVGSPPIAALLDDFDLERPGGGRLLDRVEALARTSLRWDYRRGKERWEADGEEFTPEREELIRGAATALGLLGRAVPGAGEYDHVLVLGAGVGPMMGRSRLAAETLRGGVSASTVSATCSRRRLTIQKPALPHCETEEDAVVLSLRRAFGVTEPSKVLEGAMPDGTAWYFQAYTDVKPPVFVLSGAAVKADGRRGGTKDEYIRWAESIPDDPHGQRLLVVTTDLFVPFQHCAGVRVLGQTLGCTIDTIGFDRARSPYEPAHRATELLQEIRSTVLWLREIALALDSPQANLRAVASSFSR